MSHRAGHEDRNGENRPIRGDSEKLWGHWGRRGPSGRYECEVPGPQCSMSLPLPGLVNSVDGLRKKQKERDTSPVAGWVSAWKWQCGEFRQKAGLPCMVGGWVGEGAVWWIIKNPTPVWRRGEDFVSRGGAGERGSRAKRAEVGPVSKATESTDWPLWGSPCLAQANRVMLSPACLDELQWRTKACGLG